MRYLLYILLLLLYSCEDLHEESDSLPYDFIVSEAWNYFQNENYNMSEALFFEILDIEPHLVPYYSEGYLGIGWNKLYKARLLIGNPDNFNEILELRENAHEYFLLAVEEISSIANDAVIPESLILNLYAGLSYSSSILALYEGYYSNDIESDSFVNSALDYSSLLLDIDNEYSFLYDPNVINANNIHLLRANLYINLEQFPLAQVEISLVEFYNSSITFRAQDIVNNEEIYLHVGFQGNNNTKHMFKMERYFDCNWPCESLEELDCASLSACEWLADGSCEEKQYDEYDELEQCQSECGTGECREVYSTTRTFTPLLPCSDLIIDGIDIENQEIVQCLESFPTHTLEYSFALRFPNSTVDLSEGDCFITSDTEWIDGVCVDGYMFKMESLDNLTCATGGYRLAEIEEDTTSSQSLDSCFDSCGLCIED